MATIGRIVLYVMSDGATIRPAIVVALNGIVEGRQYVNLQVFTDQLNDGLPEGTLWETKVPYSADAERKTWRWPPRS